MIALSADDHGSCDDILNLPITVALLPPDRRPGQPVNLHLQDLEEVPGLLCDKVLELTLFSHNGKGWKANSVLL